MIDMTFPELMNKLRTDIKASELNSIVLKEWNEQSDDFWKEILDYLKNENDNNKLTKYLLRDNLDDPKANSNSGSTVIGRIDELADLDESLFTSYLSEIKNAKSNIDLTTSTGFKSSYQNYFWNESVSLLLNSVLAYFDSETRKYLEQNGFYGIPTSGHDFTITDIENADAGNSFTNGNWVIPWLNINGTSYSSVRGNDKITSVLNDKSNLQFTRSTGKWIRLLMPAYQRTVEVEDLDRNFWVIAQVITAISAFLFEDESPIASNFKKIINEIMQIWENILYLWAAIALISQKPYYTKLHTEIVPINQFNKTTQYKIYDNFQYNDSYGVQQIWENTLSYLKDTYPESNLCIIPQIRKNNYEHNYYAIEKYPGAILYNRNTDTTTYINFVDNEINVANYKNYIGAIKDSGEDYYYMESAAAAESYYENEKGKFYAFVRTEPTINVSFNSSTNTINFTSFVLKLYDGAYWVKGGSIETSSLKRFGKGNGEGLTLIWTNNNGTATKSQSPSSLTALSDQSEPSKINITRGYYLGDVPSYCANSIKLNYTLATKTVKFAPIGGPHWGGYFKNDTNDEYRSRNPYGHGGKWSVIGKIDEVKSHLQKINVENLNLYIDNFDETAVDKVILFIGSRDCDLFFSASSADQWEEAATADERKKLIGTSLGGYYYRSDSDKLNWSDSYYQGHYFEPFPRGNDESTTFSGYDFSGGNYIDHDIRRFLNTKWKKNDINSHTMDTMTTLREGFLCYLNENDNPAAITDSNNNLIKLTETGGVESTGSGADETFVFDTVLARSKAASASALSRKKVKVGDNTAVATVVESIGGNLYNTFFTDGNGNKIELGNAENIALPFRYNSKRETNYRGAVMKVGDKTINYPSYHHMNVLLPYANEHTQKSGMTDAGKKDCAVAGTTLDDDNFGFGRREFGGNYAYTFVKRNEKPGKNNWFILYVQVFGTFRPLDHYFSYCKIDSQNGDTYDWYTLYNYSGLSTTSTLASADTSGEGLKTLKDSTNEDESVNTSYASSSSAYETGLQAIKGQYLLDIGKDAQNELLRKSGTKQVYTDAKLARRVAFTQVSMSSKDNSGNTDIIWSNVQVADELAAAIATVEAWKNSHSGSNWWDSNNDLTEVNKSHISNKTSAFLKYKKPRYAGEWLAKNITNDISSTDSYNKRSINGTKENKLLGLLVPSDLISVGATPPSSPVRSYLFQARNDNVANAHCYEVMKPTVTQVRCHIFAPNGDYARYEKYGLNDYGQLMGEWTEKVVTGPWAKYANIIDSVTYDLDSSYVRYDDNNYYFDFFHDPHQGRPTVPFPNKED